MAKKVKVAVLTISTRCKSGERKDTSGPALCELVKDMLGEVIQYKVVTDNKDEISRALIEASDTVKADIIFTTGGTGLAPSDVTPQATEAVIDINVPGISEAIRYQSYSKTNRAMLSRGISGIRGRTLIINMPGSEKAVRECFLIVHPVLAHAVELMNQEVTDCGR